MPITSSELSGYKFKKDMDGITAILINRKKILLLKRINVPFMTNPGIWFPVAGQTEEGETPIESAYREIYEETKIPKVDLKLLKSKSNVVMFEKRSKKRWQNEVYVFSTKSQKVQINFEHSKYLWVSLKELNDYFKIDETYPDHRSLYNMIKSCLEKTTP
jgi:8-oxo-dGTP pyrophosphatase MutT (NUDIX family)